MFAFIKNKLGAATLHMILIFYLLTAIRHRGLEKDRHVG